LRECHVREQQGRSEMRRRGLLKRAPIAAVATAASPLRLIQEALALGSVESGVYGLKGTVLVNGRTAAEKMQLKAGDVIVTGRGAELVFVADKDAFLVRENTRLELGGSAGAIILTGFRVVTGAVLSVLERGRPKHVYTSTATIGIRGTGLYAKSEPARSYVCTCYGVADIESTADPNYRETVESKHHDEPRYVYATGDAMIAQSTMQNHSDDELVMLEWLCGREVPFDSDVYR
jgi:hypothetical protein